MYVFAWLMWIDKLKMKTQYMAVYVMGSRVSNTSEILLTGINYPQQVACSTNVIATLHEVTNTWANIYERFIFYRPSAAERNRQILLAISFWHK